MTKTLFQIEFDILTSEFWGQESLCLKN